MLFCELVVICLTILIELSDCNNVCLACSGSVSPVTCTSVKTCGTHESCFADTYITSNGLINFDFGCRDNRVCQGQTLIGRQVGYHDIMTRGRDAPICSQCCTGTLCNAKLCGQSGFSEKVCYACDVQLTPDGCDQVKQCGYDERCILTLDNPRPNLARVYRSGCASNSTCESERTNLINYASAIVGFTVTATPLNVCNCKAIYSLVLPAYCICVNDSRELSSACGCSSFSVGVNLTDTVICILCSNIDLGCNFVCCDSSLCNTAKCQGNTGHSTTTASTTTVTKPTTVTVKTTTTPVATTTSPKTTTSVPNPHKDCLDIRKASAGYLADGVYKIRPAAMSSDVEVYCDMTTSGGGWTVFQQRKNGMENFNRTFLEYEQGFGSLNADFWLGLAKLRDITTGSTQLHIEYSTVYEGAMATLQHVFDGFNLGPAPFYKRYINVNDVTDIGNGQTLTLSLYPEYFNGSAFSTYDRDTSEHCAALKGSGNWFPGCLFLNAFGDGEIFESDNQGHTGCHEQFHPGYSYQKYCIQDDTNARTSQGVGLLDAGSYDSPLLIPMKHTKLMVRRK